MDVVLFHTGDKLPEFLEYTLRQFRLFNPDVNVYFLTDKKHLYKPVFVKYNILSIDKDNYQSNKIDQFESLFNYSRDNFWTVTATRLIYIENFIQEMGLTDVYHFENDVLIYYDLKDHNEKFRSLYKNMAITIGGEAGAMTGFMFIQNYKALSAMTQFFIDLLEQFSVPGVIKKYGIIMVNEMCLMRIFGRQHPEILQNLPTMPFGEMSENFQEFNSIFDPASWGQFVGGDSQKIPGCKPQDHYIGRMLTEHPEFTVSRRKGLPYFKYGNKEVKINNLHIHSKNLHLYMS